VSSGLIFKIGSRALSGITNTPRKKWEAKTL